MLDSAALHNNFIAPKLSGLIQDYLREGGGGGGGLNSPNC